MTSLTLFDIWGGMMPPEIFLIKTTYFYFPRLSVVTIAASLSGGTLDFLTLSFHMFPYNKILKVFKSKI